VFLGFESRRLSWLRHWVVIIAPQASGTWRLGPHPAPAVAKQPVRDFWRTDLVGWPPVWLAISPLYLRRFGAVVTRGFGSPWVIGGAAECLVPVLSPIEPLGGSGGNLCCQPRLYYFVAAGPSDVGQGLPVARFS
jgi:hypothetical protein